MRGLVGVEMMHVSLSRLASLQAKPYQGSYFTPYTLTILSMACLILVGKSNLPTWICNVQYTSGLQEGMDHSGDREVFVNGNGASF